MRRIRTRGVTLGAILVLVMLLLPTIAPWPGGLGATIAEQGGDMEGMATPSGTVVGVPPVDGFYAGQPIQFIHTEASDEQIAQLLTEMMSSPVILVPQLADAPGSALGNVYVFTNGVRPDGAMRRPQGFQPDVFDLAPRDPTYSPLRAVNLVIWVEGVEPRVPRSVEGIRPVEAAGELTIERPGGVVNMPLLTWPGGER